MKPRGVILRHVRHLVIGPDVDDERVWATWCADPFVPGGSPQDQAVHEPATIDCEDCSRNYQTYESDLPVT